MDIGEPNDDDPYDPMIRTVAELIREYRPGPPSFPEAGADAAEELADTILRIIRLRETGELRSTTSFRLLKLGECGEIFIWVGLPPDEPEGLVEEVRGLEDYESSSAMSFLLCGPDVASARKYKGVIDTMRRHGKTQGQAWKFRLAKFVQAPVRE